MPGTSDARLLWRLTRYGLRYPLWWLLLLGSTAAVAGSSGYLVMIIKELLDLVAAADVRQAGAIDAMRRLGWRVLALAPLSGLAFYGSWLSGQHLANRCMLDLRGEFLGHLVDLELSYHKGLVRGDLLTRITSDMDALQVLFQYLFGKALQRPAEVLGTVAFLFYIDWRFALLLLVAFAPGGLLMSRLLRHTSKRSRKARQRLAEHVSALEQITAGIKVIKAMGSAALERARYAEANAKLFAANMQMARSRAQADAAAGALSFGLVAAVALGGALMLGRGFSSGSTLLTFLTAIGRLTTLVRSGSKSYGEIQENLPAAERLFLVLDRPSRITDAPDALPCPPPRQEIRLTGVRFRYGPGDSGGEHASAGEVLRGVDLTIPIGKVVALVGESGAGKSTVLDLILRFHDVTGGAVTIDGVDVRRLAHASLLRHFALVPQDSFLFDDTIYNNIRYGRPDASTAEIEAAARRAHLHEAILALPGPDDGGGRGYHTGVGDRGERLSGGQRQRVAIARALLRDTPVLLLDEPTSALDAESEHHVREALAALLQGRTCLIVAHRLSTVQQADLIYVLRGGVVVQAGTHRELVERDGEYARLVRLQQLS